MLSGRACLKDDPGVAPFDRAILLSEPGDLVTFDVPAAGHLGLVLLEHGWSGIILVEVGRARYQVDLYAPAQRNRVFEVPLPLLPRPASATIRLLGERHPASAANQAWVYGAYVADDPARPSVAARARGLARRAIEMLPTRAAPEPLPGPDPAPPPPATEGAWTARPDTVVPVGEQLVFVRGAEADLLTLANDVGISEEIRRTGTWAARDVGLFKEIVKPGMFVLDIGANLGHHTVLFSHLVGDEGKVLACEPQGVMFGLLQTNLFMNGCANTKPLRVAVGETPGEVTLWPADYSAPTNFGAVGVFDKRGTWSPEQPGETVPLATVDDLLSAHGGARRVDFVKIDVQAYELPCLRGAREMLCRDRPTIFLEISPYWMKNLVGYDYHEIFQLLSDLGYRVYEPHQSLDTPTAREWSGEQLEEWDILAIPTAG